MVPSTPSSPSRAPVTIGSAPPRPSGPVGLWDWDLLSGALVWSDAIFRQLRLDAATFRPTPAFFREMIHAEDRARVERALHAAWEGDVTYDLQFRLRRADGSFALVHQAGAVVRENGRAVRMIGSWLDVSPSAPREDSAVRLAAIVESSNDAILSKDLAGTIRTWNAAAERIFGYRADEAIGQPITLLIPPQRRDEESGIMERVRQGEKLEHYETVRQRKDGSLVDIALTVSPIRDATGHVIGASKIARDITEQRRSREALRESEERFRLLASHAPVGIFLSDPSGNCVFANDCWERMSGLPASEALGEGWARALHPEDRDAVLAGWHEAVSRGETSSAEFRFRRPDGGVVWLHAHAVPFRDGRGFHGYLGTCTDVTQHKQAELRTRFLHRLADQLAGLDEPESILMAAQSALGEFLHADRCYFFETDAADTSAQVHRDWHRPGLAGIAGRHPLREFGTPEFAALLQRPLLQITDVREHPATRSHRRSYDPLRIRSLATAAVRDEENVKLSLAVASGEPRSWTPEELALVENVAARTWPLVARARAMQAVRENEQVYRAIGDSINYGIWVTDAGGRNTYVSESFLKLVGMTQEQCSAEGLYGRVHPDDGAALRAAWQECVRQGAAWEHEFRCLGVDGRWHPVLSRGVPVRDPGGRVVRWVGLTLDIAAFKRAQETGRQRMAMLEKLNETGRRLVAEHDRDKIVQLVTDVGREVTGAAFGAFFYNVLDGTGDSSLRFTLSGLSRELFERLPMPRSTELFSPTFRGEGAVRLDDVAADPRYARNAVPAAPRTPFPSVRSYLAVPVMSRSGEVLGGLFFGHPDPGVFTAESETVLLAVAASAAIALDNAHLYAALERELAEQRRTESMLRDSEHRWRELAEAMPHLVWTCRPDGACDYLSPQWVAYTGAPEIDQLGDGWLEFIHADDREKVAAAWQHAAGSGEIFDTEFRIRRADGTYRAFKTRAVPVRDPEGRIVKWYGTNTDMEDYRRIEGEIRKSEQQLRLVTDQAPIYLVHIDRDGRFKFVNRSYAERYGLTHDQILQRRIAEVTGEAAWESFRQHFEAALSGRRVEFEQEIPYATLGRRWVHAIFEPERTPAGDTVGVIAVITDVTTRKESELELARARDEALAASRAKDEFLAALSHELRTPLSPVLLVASDAANNPALPREIRDNFELIRANISLEARLIDDLLDLTRITRGKLPLEKQPIDVHEVLRDALGNIRPELETKDMQLDLQLKAERATISGDAVRLQQVFWNVLKNAVKFTPDGGHLRVVTESASSPDRITIEISDDGIGMTPSELARVFEAFAQGEHATAAGSHRFGGLGLGLAISQRLAEMHHGRIYATSAGRNRGSVFVVELPLLPVNQSVVDSRPPLVIPAPAGATSGRILLVEDHAATRETLQKLLTRRNFQVSPAACAGDARALASARAFDFVISDVGLPDGDGYQLMTELRGLQPQLKGIAISGYGMEDDLQRSQTAGFAAHLVKPVGITALERALAGLTRTSPPV